MFCYMLIINNSLILDIYCWLHGKNNQFKTWFQCMLHLQYKIFWIASKIRFLWPSRTRWIHCWKSAQFLNLVYFMQCHTNTLGPDKKHKKKIKVDFLMQLYASRKNGPLSRACNKTFQISVLVSTFIDHFLGSWLKRDQLAMVWCQPWKIQI